MTWLAVVLVTLSALAVVLAFLWVRKAMLLGSGGIHHREPAGERPDDDMGEMTPELREVFAAWSGPMVRPRG